MGPCAAALLSAVVVVSLFARTRPAPLTAFDQPFYLGIAADLPHLGRFTNGFVFDAAQPDEGRGSGMRFAPLYPAMLSVAASLDPVFARELDCVARTRAREAACGHDAAAVRTAQVLALIGFFQLVWTLGRLLAPTRPRVAWLALLFVLPTATLLLPYVSFVMTEITALVLFTAACAAGLAAVRDERHGARWRLASGCLFGLTALTRPVFLYLCEALAVYVFATAAFGPKRRFRYASATVLTLGMVLTLGPWLLRNALVLGHLGLTRGYDSHTLVQRIAFDAMSWREYGLSFVCWLPDGGGLGRSLFGPDSCLRFGWDERPDTFYAIGNGALMESTLAAAGGWDRHLDYLVTHFIVGDPLKYAAVTLSMALRGAWIDHYWGLVLFPLCLWFVVRDLRRGEWTFAMLALPALFVLLVNAAVAVNQVRYNLVLIPSEGLAGALAIDRLLSRRATVSAMRRVATTIALARPRWGRGAPPQGSSPPAGSSGVTVGGEVRDRAHAASPRP